ncbi:MAG TPA: radical SAM protein, partial [Myxococcota bacterium]|nr:radical SAM protein [Myxococcota bacterium]
RVGLVGAAISDHPRLVELLGAIVDSGREVGISSLRADRIALKPDIARLLRKGGYQTLTVASDAASQRLRRTIKKGTTEAHLMACAEAAAEHKYKMLKVYMMVGLPGEEEEDVEELIAFTLRLAAVHPVALGVAPFVPKLNTPLDRGEFAGVALVERRLERIQKAFRGTRAELRSTSAKWAWVEYRLAQGGPATGRAVLQAVAGGGGFGAWKRALGPEGERIAAPPIHHLL